MRNKIRPLLIFLSVALNLAFVISWAAYALPRHLRAQNQPGRDERVSCPLHRQLGATEAQWRQIEPRVVKFQESARLVCEEANRAQGDMIDLIAAPAPNREAIRAKQEEIITCQRRMQELVVDHLLNEKSVLTKEQQEQLFRLVRQQSGCAGHVPVTGHTERESMCPGAAAESSRTP
jgi:Spy/CpxP family protein refolding chaperone